MQDFETCTCSLWIVGHGTELGDKLRVYHQGFLSMQHVDDKLSLSKQMAIMSVIT